MFTPSGVADHLINPELLKAAREIFTKRAFIPGGDPGMDPSGGMGGAPGAGGMPPGMDPSGGAGGGGAPPPGMDPSGGMGAPPPPPGGGGGGGDPVAAKLDQILQALQGGGIGAQSGMNAAGGLKPKIDVNVSIMQLSKMVARIADALGIKIPASEMIATPTDLNQIAMKQQTQGSQDAAMAGGTPGGIPPMGGMADMSAGPGKTGADNGVAYAHTGLEDTMNKAAAISRLRRQRRNDE